MRVAAPLSIVTRAVQRGWRRKCLYTPHYRVLWGLMQDRLTTFPRATPTSLQPQIQEFMRMLRSSREFCVTPVYACAKMSYLLILCMLSKLTTCSRITNIKMWNNTMMKWFSRECLNEMGKLCQTKTLTNKSDKINYCCLLLSSCSP